MKGSKPTSPAYCCWRLGGRFKKGIAAEYLERGGAVVVLEGDDTMANGDVDASVMLSVVLDDLLLLYAITIIVLCSQHVYGMWYVLCKEHSKKHWWLLFVRFEG